MVDHFAALCAQGAAIDRVTSFDAASFCATHLNQRPMVATTVMDTWPARTWTPRWLAAEAGLERVTVLRYAEKSQTSFIQQMQVHDRRVTLARYVDFIEGREPELLAGQPHEWSVREYGNFFRAHPSLAAALPFETLVPGLADVWARFLWLGPRGYVTGMHADVDGVGFLAHLAGVKTVFMVPPEATAAIYAEPGGEIRGGLYSTIDGYDPSPERYPLLWQQAGITARVEPGEVLYIPAGWWHMVRAESPALSVTGVGYPMPPQ